MLDDTNYLMENNIYSLQEIAVRLHHRLACWYIQTVMTDSQECLQISYCLTTTFQDSVEAKLVLMRDGVRALYLEALRLADKNDYTKLLSSASS